MPVIFSNCFGKKRNGRAAVSSVTEVRGLSQGKGDFLIKPFEDALLKAGRSKSLKTLEHDIQEAKDSGLLEQSSVYSAESQRLQSWKSIESQVITFCDSNDVDGLADALKNFKKQKLVDENGHYHSGRIILQARLAANNVLHCLQIEKTGPLEEALAQFFQVKEKFDAISKQRQFVHSVLLEENDINKAKQLLAELYKENLLIQTNPDFPKQELEKAMQTRDLIMLKQAIHRWKRLELEKADPTFVSALRVQDQLIELCRSVAVQGLEKGLKEKNPAGIRRLLNGAKDVGLPQCVVSVYENLVLVALEKQHEYAVEAVKALHNRDYGKLIDVLSQNNISTCPSDGENVNSSKFTANQPSSETFHSDVTVSSNDEVCYRDVIENARTQSLTIANESKSVISAAQLVAKAFQNRQDSLASLDQNVQLIASRIETLVQKCEVSMDVRRSFQRSAKDRIVILQTIEEVMPDLLENLSSSIATARSFIKAFHTTLKQIKETVISWEKRNAGLSNGKEKVFEIPLADFTVVHEAEYMLSISKCWLSVSKAENSLLKCDEMPSSPMDVTKAEDFVSNIKAGLDVLLQLDLNEEACLYGLWYNIPQQQNISSHTQALLKNFVKLFPKKVVIGLRKDAKMQLVELQLASADEEARINSARYALRQAISAKSEGELIKALNDTTTKAFANSDTTVSEAERELTKIRVNKRQCRDALRVAIGKKDDTELEEALSLAEDLYLAPTDPFLVSAQNELKTLRFNKSRQDAARQELDKVAATTSSGLDVRVALARAKVCKVPSCDPGFIKAKELLDKEPSKPKAGKENHKYVIDFIRQESDKDRHEEHSAEIEKQTENFKQAGRKNNKHYLTSESICKYLHDEINNVKSKSRKVRSAENIQRVLDYVVKEKKDIPSYVIDASLKAISIVEELTCKRSNVQRKLELAIKSNAFSDLASAIASAETTPGIMDLSFGDDSDEFFELLAQAKESFALQHLHQKSEEEEKVLQQMSRARRQLKKAMMGEMDGSPLREAVATFRVICSPRSNAGSISSRKDSTKKLRIDPVPTHVFGLNSREENRRISRGKSGSGNFLEKSVNNANKLYKTESSQHTSKNTTNLKRQSLSAGKNNASRISRRDKERDKLDQNNRVTTTRKVERRQTIEKDKQVNTEQKNKQGSVEQRPSILRRRPLSAFEPSIYKPENIGATKLAWEDIDDKNIALLRKAEKNLKKIEKKEEKSKQNAENQELLKNVKDNLSANLKSSIECGDRAELWQAVHEFQRYFGDEMSKEDEQLFTKAMKALSSSTYIQYKDNLKTAILERNRNKLEHVLYQVDNDEHDYMPDDEAEKKDFLDNLSKARRLATHLSELQTYRDAVMTMTRSVVSEINSYPSPPFVVKSVMSATYLLLGETEKTVKEWTNLHALIGKLGRFSLNRRVLRCSPNSLSMAVCRLAHNYIKDITFDRVRAINAGASTFYAWTKCMINEVFERNNSEPPSLEVKQNLKPDKDKQITNISRKKPSADFWQRLARSNHPAPPKRLFSAVAKQTLNQNKKNRAKSAKI